MPPEFEIQIDRLRVTHHTHVGGKVGQQGHDLNRDRIGWFFSFDFLALGDLFESSFGSFRDPASKRLPPRLRTGGYAKEKGDM